MDNQLELIDLEGLEQKASLEMNKGEYTLERLAAQRPETLQYIVYLRAQGIPVRRVQKLCKVSPHTVLAVDKFYQDAINEQRKEVASQWQYIARLTTDEIIGRFVDEEQIDKVPIKELAMLAGIATDKSELMAGKPTARLERVEPVADSDAFKLLEAQVVDAEFTDI